MDVVVNPVNIGGRLVGPGQPCFVIAEAGVNHNGEVGKARQLIDIAVKAGADAVKFQTFRADRLATAEAPKARYQTETTGNEESQVEMLRRLELSPHVHRELMKYCEERQILFLSTPFDEESADFLEELGVQAFKIPSGEITNLPFLSYVAKKGKPVIISTGMSTLEEVAQAVSTVEKAGSPPLVLLHCVSNYPADPRDVNLHAMRTMAEAFKHPVGYSDHTLGIHVALAAVALGACVIEKHITIDRALPGPDHRASLEPHELTALVKGISMVERALGDGIKVPAPAEAEVAAVARKSVVTAKDIRAGSTLTGDMLAIKRPGTGLHPSMREGLIGRRAIQDIPAGMLLTMDMLA